MPLRSILHCLTIRNAVDITLAYLNIHVRCHLSYNKRHLCTKEQCNEIALAHIVQFQAHARVRSDEKLSIEKCIPHRKLEAPWADSVILAYTCWRWRWLIVRSIACKVFTPDLERKLFVIS